MDKKQLRTKMRAKRDKLPLLKIRSGSVLISRHFISTLYPLLSAKGPIIIYLSTQSEVYTKPLIKFLESQKRTLFVPCIADAQIRPSRITKSCKMAKKAFGIYEPVSGKKLKSFKSVSAVIVPGIAFDMKGNRLGFGGGFFDKFLKKMPKKTVKIALAFPSQILKSVPVETHDVKMDYIITDNGVYKT